MGITDISHVEKMAQQQQLSIWQTRSNSAASSSSNSVASLLDKLKVQISHLEYWTMFWV